MGRKVGGGDCVVSRRPLSSFPNSLFEKPPTHSWIFITLPNYYSPLAVEFQVPVVVGGLKEGRRAASFSPPSAHPFKARGRGRQPHGQDALAAQSQSCTYVTKCLPAWKYGRILGKWNVLAFLAAKYLIVNINVLWKESLKMIWFTQYYLPKLELPHREDIPVFLLCLCYMFEVKIAMETHWFFHRTANTGIKTD